MLAMVYANCTVAVSYDPWQPSKEMPHIPWEPMSGALDTEYATESEHMDMGMQGHFTHLWARAGNGSRVASS